MSDYYWDAGECPEALFDWVSENVAAAIKEHWEDDPPNAQVREKDGRLVLTVLGPGKPTAEDPSGMKDIYTVTFDLLEEMTEFSNPDAYSAEGRLEIAAALRKFADDIAGLAARVEEAGEP